MAKKNNSEMYPKGKLGAVSKENKNKWCNAHLIFGKNTTLKGKAELNAGLQAFNVANKSEVDGLGTMALLGNVQKQIIKSITITKANDVVGCRKAKIVKVEKQGKLNADLSCGKISS